MGLIRSHRSAADDGLVCSSVEDWHGEGMKQDGALAAGCPDVVAGQQRQRGRAGSCGAAGGLARCR